MSTRCLEKVSPASRAVRFSASSATFFYTRVFMSVQIADSQRWNDSSGEQSTGSVLNGCLGKGGKSHEFGAEVG